MLEDPSAAAPPPVDEALAYCIHHAEREGILLQETLDRLGLASFCFLSLILSVPFIQPFSLGPLTMATGLTFIACGWQMARGHGAPRLPGKARRTMLHGKGWITALIFCRRILHFCRKFTRPRLQNWVGGAAGNKRVGWLILIGGVLFATPFFNLPFNNTFPALMVLFAAIAWLERDGLMVIVSMIFGALTLLYFAVVGALLYFFGAQFLTWLKATFPALH